MDKINILIELDEETLREIADHISGFSDSNLSDNMKNLAHQIIFNAKLVKDMANARGLAALAK